MRGQGWRLINVNVTVCTAVATLTVLLNLIALSGCAATTP
jgi:hypothetical protein